MRHQLLVLVALWSALLVSRADAQTCTYDSWQGGFVYDLRLSVAGDAPLAVIRLIDPERLVAVPLEDPDADRVLPIAASGFQLASASTVHLLVTQDGLKGEIRGLRLDPDGRALGEPFTIFPEGPDDRSIHHVLFDGSDFVVIVKIGGFDGELSLVRVALDGAAVADPEPLAVENPVFLPGPAAGTIWIVEDRYESSPAHVTARVRSADAGSGDPIDVGTGHVRGAAAAANGDLLVVRNPEDEQGEQSDGLFASIVTPAGTVGTAFPFAPSGYWQVAARPGGGFLAVSSEDGTISGVALDASGAPAGPPTEWADGMNARLAGDHLAFTSRTEDGTRALSHAMAIMFDAAGEPGEATVLAELEQERVTRPCGQSCSASVGVSGDNARAANATLLVVLLIAALRGRRRRGRVSGSQGSDDSWASFT